MHGCAVCGSGWERQIVLLRDRVLTCRRPRAPSSSDERLLSLHRHANSRYMRRPCESANGAPSRQSRAGWWASARSPGCVGSRAQSTSPASEASIGEDVPDRMGRAVSTNVRRVG
jgi:hypothetical protein